jgi:transposase, IS5 family
MLSKKGRATAQLGFYSSFEEQLSHQHPLYILANKIQWHLFEEAFKKHYAAEGRPSKAYPVAGGSFAA